jgi:DNA topoisomerase-1
MPPKPPPPNYIYDRAKEDKKQCRLLKLSRVIPRLRKDIRERLDNFNYSSEDVIYLILAIMDLCRFRVGNTKYKHSTGLSTLRCGQYQARTADIEFLGKRQVLNTCQILSPKISKILGTLAESKDPDDFLFTYVGLNGQTQRVNAESINRLLAGYGAGITTKMFRTWKANYYFIKCLKQLDVPTTKTGVAGNISTAVAAAAQKLYHTKGICRRSYIDSRLVDLYKNTPEAFLEAIRHTKSNNKYLLGGEADLIKLLKDHCEAAAF